MSSYFDDVYDDSFDISSLEAFIGLDDDFDFDPVFEADDGTDLLGDNSSKPFDDSKPDATPSPGKTEPADNDGSGGGGGGQTTGGMGTNPDDAMAQMENGGDDAPPDDTDDAGGDEEGGEGQTSGGMGTNPDDADTSGDMEDDGDADEDPDADETEEDENKEDEETELDKKNLLKERYMKLYEAVDNNLTALETNKSTYNTYDSHKYSILVQKFTLLKDKLFGLITNKKFFTQDYPTCLKFYLICNELYTACVKMAEAYFNEMDKALKDGEKRKRNKSDKK